MSQPQQKQIQLQDQPPQEPIQVNPLPETVNLQANEPKQELANEMPKEAQIMQKIFIDQSENSLVDQVNPDPFFSFYEYCRQDQPIPEQQIPEPVVVSDPIPGPAQAQKNEEQEGEQEDNKDDDENKQDDDEDKSQKQGSDSGREDNDTSQLQTVGGKKCFNKLCNSKKIYKKIRSKVEIQRYRFLCKNCYENYVNNSFCQFCEQIYSNYENEQEDTKWVGCDKCQRWNHIECERKYRHKNFQINRDKDTQYQCLACSKKNRNGPSQQQIPIETKKKTVERDYEGTRNYRNKVEISKDQRIPIFYKKPQSFPYLESFLQGYNFRLWLTDANVREDIQLLRTICKRPPVDQEPKKSKKVNKDY